MTISRSDLAKQLVPGINTIYGLEYAMVDNEHLPLFDVETSQRAFEEDLLMTGFEEAPVKGEGASFSYQDAQESYTSRYVMETIATGYAITEEALEDNLYDTLSKIKTKACARAMASTKQTKAAAVFNNGFSTNLGDGVPLFSASHPTVGAGNLSNTVSADLSETALENAFIALANTRDDRNILLPNVPQSLHIPRQSIFIAERILKSPGRVDVADNDLNALRSMGAFPKGIFVNHRFTDTNAWFIRTDVPNGTKMFTRIPLQSKMDVDFNTGNILYKVRERYAFGASEWRQWYGSNGSS